MAKLDWDKQGRERRVREQGSERLGSDGLPRGPRFGNLREAAKRGAYHIAAQPEPLEFAAKVDAGDIVVDFTPRAGRTYAVTVVAADRSKLVELEPARGARTARLEYLRWERGPFTVKVAELEPPSRKRGRVKPKERSRRPRLVAAGELIVHQDGRVETAHRRRRRARPS